MYWLLSVLFLIDSPLPSDSRQQGAIDLAALSSSQALELHGQWIRVRIAIDSAESTLDGPSVFECQSKDHVSRTVCFGADQEMDQEKPFEVQGRFAVIHHVQTFIDGVPFPGFVEYRITLARRVR